MKYVSIILSSITVIVLHSISGYLSFPFFIIFLMTLYLGYQEELKKAFSTLKIDWEGSEDQSNLISKQFSNLFNSYAKAYNKMYDRRGSLFNRPFKSKVINSNHYLTKVIHYIHHNPVHHGFTDTIEAWPYSSYHALISEKNTQLKRDYIHSWFGDLAVFKDLHKAYLRVCILKIKVHLSGFQNLTDV